MNTKADRIRIVRQLSKLSQERFAEVLGTSRGAVGNWELGKGIKQENLEQISEKFDVSLDWLSRAEGKPPAMVRAKSDDLDYALPPEDGILEIDVRAGLGGGGSTDHTLVVHDGKTVDPVKSESWHFPNTFVRNELGRSQDRVRILETYGDSMAPTIQSGDRVIIDTDHRVPSPDGLYAIRDRFGSIVVKRLQALRRGNPPIIKIISDNPHHGEEEVTADELEGAIIGRVLWGLKRL